MPKQSPPSHHPAEGIRERPEPWRKRSMAGGLGPKCQNHQPSIQLVKSHVYHMLTYPTYLLTCNVSGLWYHFCVCSRCISRQRLPASCLEPGGVGKWWMQTPSLVHSKISKASTYTAHMGCTWPKYLSHPPRLTLCVCQTQELTPKFKVNPWIKMD